MRHWLVRAHGRQRDVVVELVRRGAVWFLDGGLEDQGAGQPMGTHIAYSSTLIFSLVGFTTTKSQAS